MAHIGILVGKLDDAEKFYGDILGFKEFWRGTRDPKQLSWVNMQVPDGDDYIEFMLYKDLPARTQRGTQHHLCLFVPDIEKSVAILNARPAHARGVDGAPHDRRPPGAFLGRPAAALDERR